MTNYDPELYLDISLEEREQFDAILENFMDSLPEWLRSLLEDVPVVVEDEPSAELLKELGFPPDTIASDICGLHWGTALTEKSDLAPEQSPTMILIYRGPIFRIAGSDDEDLLDQIRITLLHEIGHHFGFDETKLEALGYG